jgi:multiple sugar transport system ATP-binding protein
VFGDAIVPVEREHGKELGSHVTVGVRPEDLDLTDTGQGLAVSVDVVEELGADAYIYGQTQAHLVDAEATDDEVISKPFIARVDGRRPPEKGQTIYLKPRQGHLHMFNAESGERIGD